MIHLLSAENTGSPSVILSEAKDLSHGHRLRFFAALRMTLYREAGSAYRIISRRKQRTGNP